jgi:hypothetical protein
MNHDEMIAVIQAHKEGKTIQFKYKAKDYEWKDCISNKPSWDFTEYAYRVKPGPKKIYAVFNSREVLMGSWRDKTLAENYAHQTGNRVVIMQEVIKPNGD